MIDVHEPMEYASGHINGSLNIPLARIAQADLPRGPLVLVCQSSNRSAKAMHQLLQQGHPQPVADLMGGMPAWQQAGFEAQGGTPSPDTPGADRGRQPGAAGGDPQPDGGAGLDLAEWLLRHGPPAGHHALEPADDGIPAEMITATMVLLLAGGALIGFLLAVLGAGGSILLLPLLMSGATLPTKAAVPLSLLVVALWALGKFA